MFVFGSHGDKVEHYRVIYDDNKLTVDNEEYFENLTLLVKVMKFLRNI